MPNLSSAENPSANTLTGSNVVLRQMSASDGPALIEAVEDGQLWNLTVTTIPSASTMDAYIANALDGAVAGTVVPYAITIRNTGQVVGSTRFWRIDHENRTLEIGYTWLSASWQRTFVNTESKYLLLRQAFEILKCIRVQFTTDELNTQSRAAIARLGAKEEGIIRNELIMPGGRIRNSVYFSIIDSEWPGVKRALESKLKSSP